MQFLIIMSLMGGLVWLGYQLARERASAERNDLDAQRQMLDAEWGALDQARRVNDVFYRARDAMRQAEVNSGTSTTRRT